MLAVMLFLNPELFTNCDTHAQPQGNQNHIGIVDIGEYSPDAQVT